MNLLKQTDSNLPWIIRRYGCALRCLQAIVELESGKALTAKDIIRLHEIGVKNKNIGDNCKIISNDGVIKETAEFLSLQKYPIFKSGDWFKASPDVYVRLCYKTEEGEHFVLFNAKKGYFNPDPSVAIYKLIGVRLYDR
jgi:hypothetical protein